MPRDEVSFPSTRASSKQSPARLNDPALNPIMNPHVIILNLNRRTIPIPHNIHRHQRRRNRKQHPTTATTHLSASASHPRNTDPSSRKKKLKTHHSKAPNTHAALSAWHTFPPQTNSRLRKTASAMKPANQNSIVRASTARMANLWAARGSSHGERVR